MEVRTIWYMHFCVHLLWRHCSLVRIFIGPVSYDILHLVFSYTVNPIYNVESTGVKSPVFPPMESTTADVNTGSTERTVPDSWTPSRAWRHRWLLSFTWILECGTAYRREDWTYSNRFWFCLHRKWKRRLKTLRRGLGDKTDAIIHSAVDGTRCLVDVCGFLRREEFVGEQHFATNLDVLIRPWYISSWVAFPSLRFQISKK